MKPTPEQCRPSAKEQAEKVVDYFEDDFANPMCIEVFGVVVLVHGSVDIECTVDELRAAVARWIEENQR